MYRVHPIFVVVLVTVGESGYVCGVEMICMRSVIASGNMMSVKMVMRIDLDFDSEFCSDYDFVLRVIDP